MSKENKQEEEKKETTKRKVNKETTESYDNSMKKNSSSSIKENKLVKNIIVCIVVIAIIIGGSALFNRIFEKVKTQADNKANEKIELKYTETAKTASEGIYITDVSEVVENVMPSIVAITSKTLITSGNFGPSYFGREQYAEGAGSGIIVSKTDSDILILTNYHVVDGASELAVQFINEKSFDAKVVGTSERKDIAVISVSLKDIDKETLEQIKIATMGDSTKLKVGNGIIAIGNALGYGQSVTTGVVSALNREVTIDNFSSSMIQIDAAINGGNSGGALLNSKGEVVGINSAKYSSNALNSSASIEGMGFAIPISDISETITTLMNGEEDSSVTIGIEGYIISEQNSYNMPAGFYISKIVSGSGADKSDLEIGNIVTKINGDEITDISDIQKVLNKLKKGDKVKLTVSYVSGREYKEKDIEVEVS